MASITLQPNGRYRAQIRRKGYPRLDQIFKTRDEAVAWSAGLEVALSAASVKTAYDPSAITVRQLIEMYKTSLNFKKHAESTQQREARSLAAVVKDLGDSQANALTPQVIQIWIDKRSTQCSPDSQRLERQALRAAMDYGIQRGLSNNPVMRNKFETLPCQSREGRISPQDEIGLLKAAKALDAKNRSDNTCEDWLEMCIETGLRPGHAAGLQWGWIDLIKRIARVPRSGSKNKKPRVILLSEHMCERLKLRQEKALKLKTKFVFWSSDGKTKYAYSHPFNYCKRAIGKPELVPHLLRHEFISRLFELTDLPEWKIAELAGDCHPNSLIPYVHLRVERLRESLEEAHIEFMRIRIQARVEQGNAELMEQLDMSEEDWNAMAN